MTPDEMNKSIQAEIRDTLGALVIEGIQQRVQLKSLQQELERLKSERDKPK